MTKKKTKNKPRTMAAAFNEWMRRYTKNPDQFEHEWRSVNTFLKEQANGKKPSYGAGCEEYLSQLMSGAL